MLLMNDFKLLNCVNIHEETGYRGHGRHPLFRQSIYHKRKISVFVSPFLYFASDVQIRPILQTPFKREPRTVTIIEENFRMLLFNIYTDSKPLQITSNKFCITYTCVDLGMRAKNSNLLSSNTCNKFTEKSFGPSTSGKHN